LFVEDKTGISIVYLAYLCFQKPQYCFSMLKKIVFFAISLLSAWQTDAQQDQPQTAPEKPALIQFSGMLLTDADGRLAPVPYATVYVPNKSRGTYSDYRGFFTLVVERGDKIRFNCIGFEPVTITVPDTLTRERYSIVQLMTTDTINLPGVVIFPWPSKEHFKIEFLKMDVTPELQRRAVENLANEYLTEARKNDNIIPFSGKESANYYLRQQSREYVYIGQVPPMNIFSPLAWGQFFKAWKDGKYKKQTKKGE
jgi:CarboxypepD_reg-like domain